MKSVVVLAALGLLASLVVTGCDSSEEGEKKGSSDKDSGTKETNETHHEESSEESSNDQTGTKSLGEDCTESSECKEDKCVKFTDNSGKKRGFCSRVCTKTEDCPESGWECNLSPYTACVPVKD